MGIPKIRSSLFIDRLVQTIDIPSDDHEEVMQNLMELESIKQVTNQYSPLLKSYRYAFEIPLGDDNTCKIQIAPRKSANRYMRLEWNPASASRVCGNAFQRIIDCLTECIPSYTFNLIWKAKVTRIDLSFDLLRIRVDSISIFNDILRKSQTKRYYDVREHYAPEGRLNAIEIGKSNGDKFLLVYDKILEQESRQNRRFSESERQVNSKPTTPRIRAPITRFELRINPEIGLDKIGYLENPFEAYTALSFIKCGSIRKDHVWQFFIDSCKQRGMQTALSLIENRRERKKYRDALKICTPPTWWNPQEIWSEYKSALRQAFSMGEDEYNLLNNA